jgi:exonuclease SbcC
LGEAWASVQAHRQEDLNAARERVIALQHQRSAAAAAAAAATEAATDAARAHQRAEQARRTWEVARAAHDAAAHAWEDVAAGVAPDESASSLDALDRLVAMVAAGVVEREQATATVARLRGRLERRPQVEQSLAEARARSEAARVAVEGLREELRALAFDPAALAAATATLADATLVARAAADAAHGAEVRAATARSHAEGEAKRLADGRAQHRRLADLDAEVHHVSRVAALLSEFRNTVVASVGPRLAAQAAELFGELTDREYDELKVDPETYELQISDQGVTYGLDRFSGSEIDLANLALRVAISEHVRFQSGGTVGLLVLDEVFGPLDEDRKARMLQALEQLRGRFRQVLVVTHDASIKEQLPNALEVVKRPGRRATARVLA